MKFILFSCLTLLCCLCVLALGGFGFITLAIQDGFNVANNEGKELICKLANADMSSQSAFERDVASIWYDEDEIYETPSAFVGVVKALNVIYPSGSCNRDYPNFGVTELITKGYGVSASTSTDVPGTIYNFSYSQGEYKVSYQLVKTSGGSFLSQVKLDPI